MLIFKKKRRYSIVVTKETYKEVSKFVDEQPKPDIVEVMDAGNITLITFSSKLTRQELITLVKSTFLYDDVRIESNLIFIF